MQLGDQKLEHAQRPVVKVMGESDFQLSKTPVVSKAVARAMAVVYPYQKENLRKFYNGRRYKALEQWPKIAHGWPHNKMSANTL